jgi:hypothetical protein
MCHVIGYAKSELKNIMCGCTYNVIFAVFLDLQEWGNICSNRVAPSINEHQDQLKITKSISCWSVGLFVCSFYIWFMAAQQNFVQETWKEGTTLKT